MYHLNLSEAICPIGVFDNRLDIFENQYPLSAGISYNSYLILDRKTVLMDTVDRRAQLQWQINFAQALGGRTLDYIVISHMEPDHSGCLTTLLAKYPETTIVATAKAHTMLAQFVGEMPKNPQIVVGDGDTLCLGRHVLHFYTAPMVHWPEVMVTYEETEKVLFSADAFGRFGSTDPKDFWDDEARRYYLNIVGKYGAPVQTLLKKAAKLDIQTILPLHGCALSGEGLTRALRSYQLWSSYTPETEGVLIAVASIHGNTAAVASHAAQILQRLGVQVEIMNLTLTDLSEAVAQAFRFSSLILAASSYDGGVFTPMEDFLVRLRSKAFQKRRVALIENGSWAPSAARTMRGYLEGMKEIEIVDTLTIRSTEKPEDAPALEALARAAAGLPPAEAEQITEEEV